MRMSQRVALPIFARKKITAKHLISGELYLTQFRPFKKGKKSGKERERQGRQTWKGKFHIIKLKFALVFELAFWPRFLTYLMVFFPRWPRKVESAKQGELLKIFVRYD